MNTEYKFAELGEEFTEEVVTPRVLRVLNETAMKSYLPPLQVKKSPTTEDMNDSKGPFDGEDGYWDRVGSDCSNEVRVFSSVITNPSSAALSEASDVDGEDNPEQQERYWNKAAEVAELGDCSVLGVCILCTLTGVVDQETGAEE